MARNAGLLVVVDIEATCWEDAPPQGTWSEVIEFGVQLVFLDKLELGRRESYLVKPEGEVSPFCTSLTAIDSAMLEGKPDFRESTRQMVSDFNLNTVAWASWGDYDRIQIERECRIKSTKYPFSRTHINLKSVFAMLHGLEKEVGMKTAMGLLNLPLSGTHHRGSDDAHNIARILLYLIGRFRSKC